MHTMLDQERQRFDRQRRRTYQIAGTIGILIVAADIVTLIFDQHLLWWVRLLYVGNDLFLIAISLVVIWLVTTYRGSLTMVERMMFITFAAESLIFNGIVPPLLGQTIAQRWIETVNDDIWFLLLICTLGFHLFRSHTGVLVVTVLYGLSVAIVGGQTWLASRQGADLAPGWWSLQIYGMGAILLCFIYVISRYRAQAQRLQIQYELVEGWAFVDMLTGLPNRRRCEQALQEAIERSRRYGEQLAICIWDIDHFKRINDTYGHDRGDQVLRQIAQLMRQTIRATDLIGRWGGEEFILLLPCTGQAAAEMVVERLRCLLMTTITLDGQPVTASFGIAVYQPDDDQASLLERADQALYAAKAAGRNRVMIAV